jgi:transcriptional regulator with XRE-family HTH domain
MVQVLRDRREHLGMSQEALCHKIGVSNGVVAKWENGSKFPGAFFWMAWAQALGVKPEWHASASQ